jgi:hypothetical protein
MEFSMSETNTVSPLRQRMLEDMAARKLNPATQRGHTMPNACCQPAWCCVLRHE